MGTSKLRSENASRAETLRVEQAAAAETAATSAGGLRRATRAGRGTRSRGEWLNCAKCF
jgi:hypothetical protein